MIRKILIALFVSALAFPSFAQEDFIFSADRPGATTGTDVMEKHKVQWETGMEFSSAVSLGSSVKTLNINNSLFRFGVTDRVEVRLAAGVNYTTFEGKSICNISDLSVGTKIKIYDGYKAAPAISLLAELLIPGGKNADYLPERIGGNIHLLFNNPVCDWFSIGYDVGITFTGNPGEQEQIFAGICFGFQPINNLSLFIEEYNNFYEETDIMTEFGASYMVSKRVQIDAYADLNLKNLSSFYNVGLGVAWKIN